MRERLRVALDRVAPLLTGTELIACDNNSTDHSAAITAELGCITIRTGIP